MSMLAMQSYEQPNGFAVMDADELYYINAGSSTEYNPVMTPTDPVPTGPGTGSGSSTK